MGGFGAGGMLIRSGVWGAGRKDSERNRITEHPRFFITVSILCDLFESLLTLIRY